MSQFIEMFGNPQNNSQRRKTVRFDEVLTFQRGHDLPEKERKSEGAIPIYGSNGFVGYHTESKAKNGIVTGRSGTIGKVYCIKGDYWPLNTSLYSIDTHGNNLTYLKYMVEAFDVSRFSNGTGVPTLNRNDIHKEMIPLVDISEQEAFEVIAHQADKSEFDGFKSQFIEMTGDPRTNPKGWTVKKLPELASYSIGLTYKPEQVSESGTIVLRSGNIQNSKIDLTDVVRVDCPIKESIYVQKDDILMCSRNGSAALVGKVAQIKDINEPMTYGAFMTVIRSEYSDFLYLYFQSNDFREQVSTGKSSTMNQITQNMLDKISLPLPDGDTRKKLADILHQADKSENRRELRMAS